MKIRIGLRTGQEGSLIWSKNNKPLGFVHYTVNGGLLTLKNQHYFFDGEKEVVEQIIPLDRTPCNYGSQRIWFLCPKCSRRVAILYKASKYFLCRHCHNLTYSSQKESEADRLMRKVRKIRRRIGASENLTKPIMSKPKNMHWKTYNRYRTEAIIASYQCFSILEKQLPSYK